MTNKEKNNIETIIVHMIIGILLGCIFLVPVLMNKFMLI